MISKEDVIRLLKKNEAGACSAQERQMLESWYNLQARNAEAPGAVDNEYYKDAIWKGIQRRKVYKRRINYLKIAAAIGLATVLLIQAGLYENIFQKNTSTAEVMPAKELATLKLPDGKIIHLDKIKPGDKVTENGVSLIRKDNGELIYDLTKNQLPGAHVLSTPKGGYFQLMLPDGSQVWLNAATTLSYDVGVSKAIRQVTLEGEAYFEVRHDAKRPFIVSSKDQQVKVLGTHFNIEAYGDEKIINTSLYEGSVEVSTNAKKTRIAPGESLENENGAFTIGKTDQADGPAWRSGKLLFDGASLESILRKASRWYDIDVVYQSAPPQEPYTGGISRKSNLSALLKVLESNGVNYELQTNGTKKTLYIK